MLAVRTLPYVQESHQCQVALALYDQVGVCTYSPSACDGRDQRC